MQDMFKGNVSMQDTHTQIMSSCKTLQFRKTCLLSLVGRHDLLKDMSSCLKIHFYCFYFLCFILLKTCLFPRHVLNMAPRHDFYSAMLCTGESILSYLKKGGWLIFNESSQFFNQNFFQDAKSGSVRSIELFFFLF